MEDKSTGGRPTKYRDEYCDQILEFFDQDPFEIVTNDEGEPVLTPSGKVITRPCKLPTFERFAHSICVHKDTLYEWASKIQSFSDAMKKAKQIQHDILVQNGLTGGYNNTFAIFVGKSCMGMRDGNEADQEAPKPLNITFNVEDARVTTDA